MCDISYLQLTITTGTQISFFPQGTSVTDKENHVFIPIKYNFATGVLNPWRGESDTSDMTVHSKGSRDLSDFLKRVSQPRYLSSLPLVERVLTQASIKDVPVQLGGPGKLFVIVKHLCSRPLSDLKAFII